MIVNYKLAGDILVAAFHFFVNLVWDSILNGIKSDESGCVWLWYQGMSSWVNLVVPHLSAAVLYLFRAQVAATSWILMDHKNLVEYFCPMVCHLEENPSSPASTSLCTLSLPWGPSCCNILGIKDPRNMSYFNLCYYNPYKILLNWRVHTLPCLIFALKKPLYQNSVNLWRARLLLSIWVVIGCQRDLLLLGRLLWMNLHRTWCKLRLKRHTRQSFTEFYYKMVLSCIHVFIRQCCFQ